MKRMISTSVLVLAAVVVLPLVSLLIDLVLLEAGCSRRHITALIQAPTYDPTATRLLSAVTRDESYRQPTPESATTTQGSPSTRSQPAHS